MLTSVVLPGVSYLFTWPLLFGLLALIWILFAENQELNTWQRVVVFSIAAVPGIILCIPAAYLLFPWMNRFEGLSNMPLAGVPTAFVALLVGLLIPHLALLTGEPTSGKAASGASSRRKWLVPCIIALLSFVFLGAAFAMSGFSADHPRPDNINYVLDADSGKAVWISKDQNLDSWTSRFFPMGARKSKVDLYPFSSIEAFMSPPPGVSLAPPEVRLLNDTMSGDERILDLRMSSPRHAVNSLVKVEAQGKIEVAVINGIPLPLDQEHAVSRSPLEFMYSALPLEGINLTLIVLTHGDFDHTGNAAYLRKKFGTEIDMHDGDSGMVERGDMFSNRNKGNIILGILTAGGDLFCGDLIMNEDKPGLNSNIDDSMAANVSVEKLKSLKINTVYPGHGKPFPWEQFLRNYREKNREEN